MITEDACTSVTTHTADTRAAATKAFDFIATDRTVLVRGYLSFEKSFPP